MSRVGRSGSVTGIALVAVIALLLLCAGPGAGGPAASSPDMSALCNPGFEDPYYSLLDTCAECSVAEGWSLWHTEAWRSEPWIFPPKADGSTATILSGSKAQRLWTDPHRAFDACLYQQVGGITPGDIVRFTAWAKVVSAPEVGDVGTRVGIDPNGGTDPTAIPYDQYPTYWAPYTAGDQAWQELSVAVHAASEMVTFYACAHPQWPSASLFSVYWDEASYTAARPNYVYLPLVLRDYFVWTPGTLHNPDLELDWGIYEGYQSWSDIMKVLVAPYWQPFWNYVPDTTEFKIPEYGYPDRAYRVRSGEVSQQYGLSGWGCFEAGIYQVITGATPGATYEFELWGLGWSSLAGGNDLYSDVQEGLNFKVGIDPTGGDSYTSSDIVWSESYDPYDAWHRFAVTATVPVTSDGQISVWAYAHPAACWIRFNQVFWDTGSLRLVSSP